MATIAGVKISTKPKKSRDPLFMDEKYTGGEPHWPADNITWDDDVFDNRLRRSFYYYNYYYNQKSCKKYVLEWMSSTDKYSKQDLKIFNNSTDKWLPMTVCSLVMAARAGMEYRSQHIEFMHKSVREVIERAIENNEVVDDDTSTTKAYVPTIQDRMNERTAELIGELEGYYDDIDTETVKFYDWLTKNNVVQSQLARYEHIFGRRKTELEDARDKKDDQLKEGYSHYKAADFKKRIAWLDDLLNAIEQYRGVKKATKKARVKKAPSKEKLVAKLKYAKEDKALKLVSCNPADIIGASELWVYNTKTRKLGRYVAAAYQVLGIKGTSITGFDSDKSVCKTLRKPEEKLKEFSKAGKIQLRKFLDDIKATEAKMNGRISNDIVLLKAA
jgi:hypothetical protein